MAGFGLIIAGALGGWSDARLDEIRAERDARLKELDAEKDRAFRSSEADKERAFQASENEKTRTAKADSGSSMTSDMKEYEVAKAQGFTGTFMEYQVKMKEAGRQQVNIDTGTKLPPGYRWKDQNNQEAGVEPIPGGPATAVPAELAARIGIADNFLAQLPSIREHVKSGEVTGPVDKTTAAVGVGAGSNTYRQIQSGVDALKRMLSGAGLPQAEADEYASRYLPTYADDSTSLLQKLDQLEGELKSSKEMALRGRGDAGKSDSHPSKAPAIGSVEEGYRFKGGDPSDKTNWEPVQ